ncbi:MAG TPA: ATP-binding cassette domain-containing protein, partial [Candidatus Hydrogenedentes bacterium]|nr:ATP-binding cassette domain-containing protein [Candidatus Hydrogenedentota bacterium]
RYSPAGVRFPARERQAAASAARRLSLRAASLDMPVENLSGGNQQKVVLAKWMLTEPRLILLDEPTRGVDVGAKHEIYRLLFEWSREGVGILLITSEMPELLALSDRIMVLHRGRVTGWFTRETATPEAVLAAAMGRATEEVTA